MTKVAKLNMILLYISCIIGLRTGMLDYNSNAQSFFYMCGGEDFLSSLNTLAYIFAFLTLFLLFFDIKNNKIKWIIIISEYIKISFYFIIFLTLLVRPLNIIVIGISYAMIFLIDQVLFPIWTEYEFRLIPGKFTKEYFGTTEFLVAIFSFLGLLFSYYVFENFNDNAYIILFGLGVFVTFIGVTICAFTKEKLKVKNDTRLSIKDNMKLIFNDDNFSKILRSRIFYNIASGLPVLYAFLAIKANYSEADIALMGIIYFIIYGIAGYIWGKVKLLNSQIILLSHFLSILGIISAVVFNNIHIAFAFSAFGTCGASISYQNIINFLCKESREKKLILMFSMDWVKGLGIALFSLLVDKNLITAGLIAIVCMLISMILLTKTKKFYRSEKFFKYKFIFQLLNDDISKNN